jgi:antitoxin MazE
MQKYILSIYSGGYMLTHVTKWGNSLGLRIPRFLAQSLGLKEGSPLEIDLEDQRLIIRKGYTLESLLSQVTPENTHSETEAGREVGKEIWE